MLKWNDKMRTSLKGDKKFEYKVQFPELKGKNSACKPSAFLRPTTNRLHSALGCSNLPNYNSISNANNNSRYIYGRSSSSLERSPTRSESLTRSALSCRKHPSPLRTEVGNISYGERKSSKKLQLASDSRLSRKQVCDSKVKPTITERKGKPSIKVETKQPVLMQNCINQFCNVNSGNAIEVYDAADPVKTDIYASSRRNRRTVSHSPRKLHDKETNDNEKSLELIGCDKTSQNDKSKLSPNSKMGKPCYLWKFEKGVMWSYNQNGGKRIGYLLFNTAYLETPLVDAFGQKYEMAYKFSQADSKLIRILMENHGFKEVGPSSSYFNLYWSNTHFSPSDIRQLQEWQKINHFPRSSELTRKDRLYTNIKRMQRQFGVKIYDIIPTSFVLPTEYREFCDTHLREKGIWIVKPVASSQGKGIYLVSQVDQVPPDEISLVCRYLDTPLLVDGYKCDLRLYVAVTSLDPMIVYLYEEGLVRLATIKYQTGKNLWNPCIHLTNYSVNKFHSNYVQNEDPDVDDRGNKWSLSAFLRHLKARGIDTGALMRTVEDVIIKSILSASYQMNTATNMFVPHPRNCFELYGFDILIDSQLKPWILEINLSPSLNIDQPLDLKIKSSMLADLFSLIGIPLCNPNTTKISNRPSIYRKLPNLRHSTDSLERVQFSSRWGHITRGNCVPSVEELRTFRQMREEYERKGGWARIYPTPDSWAMYGTLQEYDSPLNYVLHCHLFPNAPRSSRFFRSTPMKMSSVSSLGLASSLERLICYERTLPKGLSFIRSARKKEEKSSTDLEQTKTSLIQALENGLALSKYQARMTFSVYLQHVQRRLMIGCNQEKQTDLVYRFLRSASRTLHLPISVQTPSRTLPKEARAVVISKQLGDFIQAYTKETHMYLDQQSSSSCSSLSPNCPASLIPTPSEPSQSTPFGGRPEGSASSGDDERTSEAVSQIDSTDNLSIRSKVSTSSQVMSASSLSDSSEVSASISLEEARSSAIIRQHSLSSMRGSGSSGSSSMRGSGSSGSVPRQLGYYESSSLSDNPMKKRVEFFQSKLRRFKSEGDSGLCSTDDEASGQPENEDSNSKDSRSGGGIAMELYRAFLSHAGESDLEEILALQTRLHNSVGVFLDPARKSRAQHSSSSSNVTTPSSRPRTPAASPHGSPRRARKSPLQVERVLSERDETNPQEPIVSEPQSASKKDVKRISSSSKTEVQSLSLSAPPSCCIFGNILKASLRGTKSAFGST